MKRISFPLKMMALAAIFLGYAFLQMNQALTALSENTDAPKRIQKGKINTRNYLQGPKFKNETTLFRLSETDCNATNQNAFAIRTFLFASGLVPLTLSGNLYMNFGILGSQIKSK